jgi:hypothetical protein
MKIMSFSSIFVLSWLFVSSLFFSGCVEARFEKKIEVHRDANGKIIKTVETETVTQPGHTSIRSVQPEYLHYNKNDRGLVEIRH